MLNLWLRFLRYWMPAEGKHSSPIESGAYPVLKPDPVWGELPSDEGEWLPDYYDDYGRPDEYEDTTPSPGVWPMPDDEDYEWFPIVCPNGCPEGYLGRHKFSCPRLRDTLVDFTIARPYIPKQSQGVNACSRS